MDPKERLDSVAYFWKTKRLPEKDRIRIEVNHVKNPHQLFFNVIDESYEETFMPLMKKLQELYRGENASNVIPKSSLKIALPCIVRHQKVYFRGIIISKMQDYVKVRTIDYGEDVTITRAEYNDRPLYWMNRSLATIPIMAISGGLKFLEPVEDAWSREATTLLMDLLQNREVNAVIVNKDLPGGTVDMCLECPQTGENIEMELVKAKLACFIGSKDSDDVEEDIQETMEKSDRQSDEKVDSKDIECKTEVENDSTPLINQVMRAVDASSSDTSCSDDELGMSVRVYSTDGSICDEAVEQDRDEKVMDAVEYYSEEVEDAEKDWKNNEYSCEEDGEYDNYEEGEDEDDIPSIQSNFEDHRTLAAPSEAMTSVSVVGRLSNINLSTIKDSVEREKVKQEIVLEMQSLQQRLAELNRIVSSDEDDSCTVPSTSLSPSAPEFVPKHSSNPPRHREMQFSISSQSSSGLRPDAEAFFPKATSVFDTARMDSSLSADATSFTPSSPLKPDDGEMVNVTTGDEEAVVEEESDILDDNVNPSVLSADAKSFAPQRSRNSDFGVSNPHSRLHTAEQLYQTAMPTHPYMQYQYSKPPQQYHQQPVVYRTFTNSGTDNKVKAPSGYNNLIQPSYANQSSHMFVRQESWLSNSPQQGIPWQISVPQASPQIINTHRRDTIMCYQPTYAWHQG